MKSRISTRSLSDQQEYLARVCSIAKGFNDLFMALTQTVILSLILSCWEQRWFTKSIFQFSITINFAVRRWMEFQKSYKMCLHITSMYGTCRLWELWAINVRCTNCRWGLRRTVRRSNTKVCVWRRSRKSLQPIGCLLGVPSRVWRLTLIFSMWIITTRANFFVRSDQLKEPYLFVQDVDVSPGTSFYALPRVYYFDYSGGTFPAINHFEVRAEIATTNLI